MDFILLHNRGRSRWTCKVCLELKSSFPNLYFWFLNWTHQGLNPRSQHIKHAPPGRPDLFSRKPNPKLPVVPGLSWWQNGSCSILKCCRVLLEILQKKGAFTPFSQVKEVALKLGYSWTSRMSIVTPKGTTWIYVLLDLCTHGSMYRIYVLFPLEKNPQ